MITVINCNDKSAMVNWKLSLLTYQWDYLENQYSCTKIWFFTSLKALAESKLTMSRIFKHFLNLSRLVNLRVHFNQSLYKIQNLKAVHVTSWRKTWEESFRY